jgi:hypothetical protein
MGDRFIRFTPKYKLLDLFSLPGFGRVPVSTFSELSFSFLLLRIPAHVNVTIKVTVGTFAHHAVVL